MLTPRMVKNREVMHLFFPTYKEHYVTAKTTHFVYKNTTEHSKLRKYVKDLILNEGPLSYYWCEVNEPNVEDWIALIREGGDMVKDIALEGSFRNQSRPEKRPYYWANQSMYLEDINITRSAEDIIQGKKRSR
jgi:hypothetical protein